MKNFLCISLIMLVTIVSYSQSLHYKFSAPNAVHHEAEISVTAKGLPKGNAIFRMSRSSPGRYATHEFGKNIYHLRATDSKGNELQMQRTEAEVYSISNPEGEVTLHYTLFANHADGTYASVDNTGFHLNIPATFMWVSGMDNAPISLEMHLPDSSWKIATQLFEGKTAGTFTAPNFQYFMDAPIKAGRLRFREWEVKSKNGKSQTIRIAFETEAGENQLDQFAEKVKKICAESAAVFGEYPSFDNGSYTFIASLNPFVEGDGMEHRNSTMISLGVNADNIENSMGIFSHEFFHAWNVERIRPKTLEPFNYERSNVSDALWLAEGFTQYYGDLIMLRSGLRTELDWLNSMSRFINTKQHRPGGNLFSVINNSQQAVFTDAGRAVDKNNFANIHSSYYITGAATALAMDLELRTKYGKTLDDFMKTLWKKHGFTEVPYSIPDLQAALAETTGDAAHAANFFQLYVYSSQLYDYHSSLQKMGVATLQPGIGKAWVGATRLDMAPNGNLQLAGPSIFGTPLYNAGLDEGHAIESLNDRKFTSVADFNKWLEGQKPGDNLKMVSWYKGMKTDHTITLSQKEDVKLELGTNTSGSMQAARAAWWGSQVK